MEPGEAPLDDPAIDAEAAAVFRATASDSRENAALSERAAMRRRIVGAVGEDERGAMSRSAARSAQGRHAIDQRQQLGDVVLIGTRQHHGQRDARSIRHEVAFAARTGAVRRIGTRFFPPPTARTDEESTTARDPSMCSAW